MNNPKTVIAFINAAHFLDHFAMLIFATTVVVMAPALGIPYAELLPYATPGFVAFGAGSLLTGWLGDVWSRRNMMVIFFLGLGSALIGAALATSPLQLGAALFAVGVFASIYHPVGTAMLVAHSESLGRQMGMNGMWGNFGVALSALLSGLLVEIAGWHAAFLVPGLVAIVTGVAFLALVRDVAPAPREGTRSPARVPRELMGRVVVSLVLTILASSAAFNAVTVSMPKLLAERIDVLAASPTLLGVVAAGVYLTGAAAQWTVGRLLDRASLRHVFLPLACLMTPALLASAFLSGAPLVLAAAAMVVPLFGLVTVNDAMLGKYTSDRWRGRAYAARYFLGFTTAGVSVGLVAILHEQGGFALLFQALAVLTLLPVAGALLFPTERRTADAAPAPV